MFYGEVHRVVEEELLLTLIWEVPVINWAAGPHADRTYDKE